MLYGPKCLALCQRSESCAVRQPDGTYKSYADPGTGAAPWTIGWGTTGAEVGPRTIWTQAQCDAALASRLMESAVKVTNMLRGVETTQNQFDALVDFAYNCGSQNLATSTLLRKHCAGDYAGAAMEFSKWVHAAGHIMPGLVTRRAAETALYLSK